MQNSFKIYPEIHIAVSKLSSGVKSMEELLDFVEQLRNEKNFSEVHYQLTDLRNCVFDFDPGRIEELKSIIEHIQSTSNQIFGVYLVNQPDQTAYIQLLVRSLKYVYEFCSTLEKAYSLFALPISFEDFELLLHI